MHFYEFKGSEKSLENCNVLCRYSKGDVIYVMGLGRHACRRHSIMSVTHDIPLNDELLLELYRHDTFSSTSSVTSKF